MRRPGEDYHCAQSEWVSHLFILSCRPNLWITPDCTSSYSLLTFETLLTLSGTCVLCSAGPMVSHLCLPNHSSSYLTKVPNSLYLIFCTGAYLVRFLCKFVSSTLSPPSPLACFQSNYCIAQISTTWHFRKTLLQGRSWYMASMLLSWFKQFYSRKWGSVSLLLVLEILRP